MSDTAGSGGQFGTGPLAKAAALVYTLMIVELLLLVANAPGIVGFLLLYHDASNIPLMAACAVPAGPALSAALYALHHHRGDLTDLRPARAFLRGYRLNAWGVVKVWVPWLAWMAVLGVNLAVLPAAGLPGWFAVPLVTIALIAALWMVNALVITSLFSFRARDIARLSGYFLLRAPGAAVGSACVLIVAVGVTLVTSEVLTAVLCSVLVLMLVGTSRPMADRVREEFTG